MWQATPEQIRFATESTRALKRSMVGGTVSSTFLQEVFSGKIVGSIAKHPWGWGGGVAVGVVGWNTGRALFRSIGVRQPAPIKPAGGGPGYISWAKKSGMPHNHLGTEGLSLALNKMRHSSTI